MLVRRHNRRLFAGQYADIEVPYTRIDRGSMGHDFSPLADGTGIRLRSPDGGWWSTR
jgi:hypothetical protein